MRRVETDNGKGKTHIGNGNNEQLTSRLTQPHDRSYRH